MVKNNTYINMVRDLYVSKKMERDRMNKNIDELMPTIYAAFVMALHRKEGWGYKRISKLLAETQVLWEEYGKDIISLCEKETGISVEGQKQVGEKDEQ